MEHGTAETTVLRADFGAYRRWFGTPIRGVSLFGGLIGVGVVSAFSRGDGALLVCLLVGAVVGTLGCIAIHIATSRVILTADGIESRRWLRRTRLRLDDDLTGALADVAMSSVGRTSQILVLRARSGGPRIRLNGAYWDREDLLRIASVAGATVIESHALTPKKFEKIAPGSMPWRHRHPWAFGLGAGIALVALVVGGVLAWWDAKGRPPFDDQPPRAVSTQTVQAQDAMVADLERAMGGEWERPTVRLDTCQDDDNYKGWRREVHVDVRETVVDDTGEAAIVTPITPTPELIAAISRAVVDAGHGEPYADDVAGFEASRYLRITSYPDDDALGAVAVDVTFNGTDGQVSISVDSPCETPPR